MTSCNRNGLKGVAQCLINNERTVKEASKHLKTLREEQVELKSQIDSMMQEASIDQLRKSGALIERKIKERKVSMSKEFVEATLRDYLKDAELEQAMNRLYTSRPKISSSSIKCTLPKKKDVDEDNDDTMSTQSESYVVANQFGLNS